MSYSHTLSVQNREGRVWRCCSFRSSPRARGAHWDVHKGVILDIFGKHRHVVKVSKNLQSPSAQVKAELDKFSFVRSVLQQCPAAARHVKLVPTHHSEIDKVGRLYKLAGKSKKGQHNENLREDTKVVVQEHREGDIQCLLDIGRSKTQSHHPDTQASLLTLVHHSYAFSRGQCVIAGVKGVRVCDDKGRVTYHVTSLTIHSREKKYGEKDEGVEGMALYKVWSGLHHSVLPTAPPLKASDTCAVSTGSTLCSRNSTNTIFLVPLSKKTDSNEKMIGEEDKYIEGLQPNKNMKSFHRVVQPPGEISDKKTSETIMPPPTSEFGASPVPTSALAHSGQEDFCEPGQCVDRNEFCEDWQCVSPWVLPFPPPPPVFPAPGAPSSEFSISPYSTSTMSNMSGLSRRLQPTAPPPEVERTNVVWMQAADYVGPLPSHVHLVVVPPPPVAKDRFLLLEALLSIGNVFRNVLAKARRQR